MKTTKSIIILVLFLTFSCQQEKKSSERNTDSKIELDKNNSEAEPKSDNNSISKKNSENAIFRDITELEKYNGFEKISGSLPGRFGDRRGDYGAGVFQRQPTSGNQRCGENSRPECSSNHQRTDSTAVKLIRRDVRSSTWVVVLL